MRFRWQLVARLPMRSCNCVQTCIPACRTTCHFSLRDLDSAKARARSFVSRSSACNVWTNLTKSVMAARSSVSFISLIDLGPLRRIRRRRLIESSMSGRPFTKLACWNSSTVRSFTTALDFLKRYELSCRTKLSNLIG
ncbi:hypothetical protein Ae201684P_001681 [Aphanomyces euteiches]|uniref:Uncharacterized protein n=1 Tax=Aphanomyces euteiches TaxID=100861 RepID=A0A6G0X9E1_9STRA|nr:hypothetical protein Ae201684_007088 [Aphanomyces euteiches]KAH9052501.1 hypothetical protein Ae201684P_001681 [Aphanomyces euteiches]